MKFSYFIDAVIRIFKNKVKTKYNQETDNLLRGYSSIILMLASIVMTILNVVKGNTAMTISTSLMAVGFFVSAALCFLFNKTTAAGTVMSLMCAFMFSMFAVTGENDGFAILWILLVPIMSMSIVGIYRGNLLCMYFLIFLIVIFYTPANRFIADAYTETFKIRFPVLFLVSYIMTLYLMIQKDYYFYKTEIMAYEDELSGLRNRRFYDEKLETLAEKELDDDLAIVSIDLNKLKYYNDTFGHEAGDELIASASKLMKKNFKDAEAVCRTGGDEFMIISEVGRDIFEQQIADLQKDCEAFEGKYVKTISLAIGVAYRKDNMHMDIDELEKEADRKMYESKASFYRQGGNDRRRR